MIVYASQFQHVPERVPFLAANGHASLLKGLYLYTPMPAHMCITHDGNLRKVISCLSLWENASEVLRWCAAGGLGQPQVQHADAVLA